MAARLVSATESGQRRGGRSSRRGSWVEVQIAVAWRRVGSAGVDAPDCFQLDLALMWTGLGVGLVSTVAGITLLAIGGGEAERPGEDGATVRGGVEFEASF